MIYNCKILDPDGKTHDVSITLRGVGHSDVLIISGVSMEAYHQGLTYKELVSYTKEMEGHGKSGVLVFGEGDKSSCSESIMAAWMEI